jgi:hypothetical protein
VKLLYVILQGAKLEHRFGFARRLSAELNDRDPRAVIDTCDAPLKHFVAAGLNEKYHALPMDKPASVIHGSSIEEFMQQMATYMRNEYGPDVFGRMLAYRHLRHVNTTPGVAQFVKYVIIPELVSDDDVMAFSRTHMIQVGTGTFTVPAYKAAALRCVEARGDNK